MPQHRQQLISVGIILSIFIDVDLKWLDNFLKDQRLNQGLTDTKPELLLGLQTSSLWPQKKHRSYFGLSKSLLCPHTSSSRRLEGVHSASQMYGFKGRTVTTKWFQASRSTGQKMATPLLPNYISSIQVTNQVKRQQHLNSWEDLICWVWVQLVGVREQDLCSDNATFAANRMQASLEGSYGLGRWLHHYSSLLSFPCHPLSFILFILVLKSSKVLMPCGTNKARMPFPSLETTVP